MKTTSTILLSAFALAASTLLATAQDNNNRERGGDRRGNMEDFQKRMNERLKASLKVTDEEWAVMQPLIEKVQTKQRDASSSRFGGGRRGGGDNNSGGNNNSGPARPGEAESTALRTALENEGSSPEDIKAKLASVRNQRQKAVGELAQAREELKKVVTVRQEATLVSMGILE